MVTGSEGWLCVPGAVAVPQEAQGTRDGLGVPEALGPLSTGVTHVPPAVCQAEELCA